jgi:hypothetical protein
MLNGFLVSSSVPREGNSSTSRSGLLRAGEVTPIGEGSINFAADLPRLGVAAILGSSQLSFVDGEGRTEEVSRLNSGDDYNGWEAFNETSDEGWLYADGAQYDHAVRVDRTAGTWQATSIVRISDEAGLLEAVMRMLIGMDRDQMERDRLTKIIRVGPCRKFSKAVGRMIFCDRMQELRAGELSSIGGGTIQLTHFLGDLGHLGLAIFRGADAHLYSYNGETLRLIPGETVDRGIVHDLPAVGRAFLSTRAALFEMRGDAEALEVVKLEIPEAGDFFFTPLQVLPGGSGTIAFTRQGIYRVDGTTLSPLWNSGKEGPIDTTGHTVPVDVKGWNGILFTTRPTLDEAKRFHLLTPCGPEARQ